MPRPRRTHLLAPALATAALSLIACGDSSAESETQGGSSAGSDASAGATTNTSAPSSSSGASATGSGGSASTSTSTSTAGPTTPASISDTNDATSGSTGAPDTSASASTDASTGASTTADATTTGASTAVDTLTTDSGDSSDSGDPMCQGPQDCPPPPVCMDSTCTEGQCGTSPSPAATPCEGDGLCDGQGVCVECLQAADCPSQVCDDGVCQPASCDDGIENGAETDVDCGGDCPDKCAEGQGCQVDGDCETDSCDGQVCQAGGAACLNAPPNPATGQGCPLFSECSEFSDCGVFQDCQQWYCDAGQCALNTLSNCWDTVGGQCVADVVITQHVDPPVDKDFLPPDGVDFREVGSLTITIQNNTADDLYLDNIPLQLNTSGGGSSFDVSSLKLYQDFGGSDWETPGDFFFCITGNPFQFPQNGVLGPCGGSFASRVAKNGGTRRFVITFAFAKEKTFINGRSYRLRLDANADLEFRVGGTQGPPFQGSQCGIPNTDFVGAWVNAKSL